MFKHELYKVVCNKASIAFVIVVFIINAFQLIWLEDNNYWYPQDAYCTLWDDLRASAGDSVEGWQTVIGGLEAEIKKMKDSHYDMSVVPSRYTGSAYYDTMLYNRVIAEIESTLGYEEYLAEIELTKMRYEALGSLVDRDNYVYRNLMKSAALYEGLEPIELIPEQSAGVIMATGSDVTDFLAFALFLFFGINVWLKEKEQGMLGVIRTTKNGRARLALTKIGTLVMVCVSCTAVLYISNIVIAENYYGLGDVSRSVVTVDEYRGTLWRISVMEFLTYNLIFKLVTFVWLSLLVSIICVGVSGSMVAFGTIALMCAGSYAMYTGIPALSVWAVFKYLNPFGIIKTELMFQEFRGINIFGWPFDYRKCVAVILIVGCILFAAVTVRLFVRTPVMSVNYFAKFTGRVQAVFIKVRRKIECHVSITGHEFHRIFVSGGIIWVVLLALVIQVSFNKSYTVGYSNLSEYFERNYLEELSGAVTDEKVTFIASEEERLLRPKNENEQEQQKALMEIQERLAYLEGNEGTYFVYDKPFGKLTAADRFNDDLSQATLFIILLALAMPLFFAPEWQTGMRKVVSVTLHGRRRLVNVRYVMGALLVAAFFMITYLPPFMQVFKSYDMKWERFAYPAASLPHLAAFGTGMSIGTYMMLMYALRLAIGVLAALFIYKLSALIKSHVYTMAAAFIMLIPVLLASIDYKLEFVAYPMAAFAGNMAMQSGVAAVVCAMTIVVITVVLWILNKRRRA